MALSGNINRIIGRTRSICPLCGKQLPAERIRGKDGVYLRKRCAEHGEFRTIIWREGPHMPRFEQWRGDMDALSEHENLLCPQACGLCEQHQQDTCCVLYELTRRCDLHCSFCFADGGQGEDIPLTQVKADIDRLVRPGATLLQLSGGEPALRDDLPEIIAYARKAGCRYVQLNTNGLRIAADKEFLARLKEAGLSFVFMQFDGMRDEIYRKLRGRPLLSEKIRAIDNCAELRLGITLVPTLVPGVNTDDIGNIIRYALKRSPAVRGVHFQPVSYFGRYAAPPRDETRYTLSELLAAIPAQTAGLITPKNIAPSHCDHPLCGFHAAFINAPGKPPTALTQPDSCCCGMPKTEAADNREYIGRRWQREENAAAENCAAENGDGFDTFLRQSREYAFTITAMAFQDAWNLDIERLRRCSLHVWRDGRHIPFCAHYLSMATAYDKR